MSSIAATFANVRQGHTSKPRPVKWDGYVMLVVSIKHHAPWWRGYAPYQTILQRKILKPGVNHMEPETMNVGHTAHFTLVFLDANKNPMLTQPTPDVPPVWTDDAPTVGTLTTDPTGLTADDLGIAPGVDDVTVTLAVNGVLFIATQTVGVTPVPQVLTSVAIVTTIE